MAAYASLVSLMQIIDQIEHHPSPPISINKKQVESLIEIVTFLQAFLEGYNSPYADGDEADPLEMRIADAVYAAEDVIESHIVDQIRLAVLVYEGLAKVMEHLDLIMKEVTEIVAGKNKLKRRVSASLARLYERMMELIEHMDWIKKEALKIVAVVYRADSSACADLYESLVKVICDVDLIKREVMEIVANLCRRRVLAYVNSATSAYLYKCMMLVTEYVDLIKKEVTEIVARKDQLRIQVSSASAGLYDGMGNVIEEMLSLQRRVLSSSSSVGLSVLRNNSLAPRLNRPNNATMVGFDGVLRQLMERLIGGKLVRQVIPIVGMGGIGKTTLARNVYAKPLVRHHFDICAWVTISQQYNTKELLGKILSQASNEGRDRLSQMTEDEIGLALHKCLSYRRYLIVLDDMCSVEAWEEMQCYLPDNSNGSRIVVTTRLLNMGSQLDNYDGLEMKFVDKGNSWNLFCKIVFGGESCPFELEKIGKKIVNSCRGLPLSIVVMGGLLGRLERTKECWKSIEGSIDSMGNSENDEHCLKILKLSYKHLTVYLKPCFLYMGTYEEDSEIRVSRVIKLWVSEGFLKPISGKSLETVAKEYLDELVDRNLILVHEFGKTGNLKYLKIHDLLRDLCLREAEKERFYHVVGLHSPQGMCSQRRVVIPRSTSDEKVVDVMKFTPHARSYIRDHERVQPLPNLKLLRILNAALYTIHRYSAEKMLNLRLLDVSDDNRRLLSSIDFLWSLQTLIGFHRQDPCNAPVKIWNMSQLRHVCFRASSMFHGRGALHLPDPPSDDNIVVMENLQTLKGVMNFKCDEMMVCRIPNIKKLGLIGSLHDVDVSLHNIQHLQKLESLSCEFFCGSYVSNELTFPRTLKSLTLGIIGGGMEDIMEKVSALPLLQKLKLSHGHFTTRKWETVEGQFPSLKYLSLAWCRQLEWWKMESSHFPCLEQLRLCHLEDLKEIPAELGEIPSLKYMALEYCSKSAVRSAKRMVEKQEACLKVAVPFGKTMKRQESCGGRQIPTFMLLDSKILVFDRR